MACTTAPARSCQRQPALVSACTRATLEGVRVQQLRNLLSVLDDALFDLRRLEDAIESASAT